jgi:hypothetical protein
MHSKIVVLESIFNEGDGWIGDQRSTNVACVSGKDQIKNITKLIEIILVVLRPGYGHFIHKL